MKYKIEMQRYDENSHTVYLKNMRQVMSLLHEVAMTESRVESLEVYVKNRGIWEPYGYDYEHEEFPIKVVW